ncbi:MAG: bifunctional riboflavin kinase/FAD synthetase [Candidatus Krumholzibacteriota bacterium]|nr:bifunctional riboflavin kinase/FAD synthetase [Candidatus Krumholzibacteriota bacterium]
MPFRVAYDLAELERAAPRNTAVTLGVFDGVHRGHRRIVDEVVACRSQNDVSEIWLITFDPHPVVVTHSRETPPILSTIAERLELLKQYELDGVFVVRFDEATARMDYRDFIKRYMLDGLDMRRLVLGYDCHFGHKRQGSPQRVVEEGTRLGFQVAVVPPVELDGKVVSSTHIRETLMRGDLASANHLLGHPYVVVGTVVSGQGKGSELGFPTANIAVSDPLKLWPPEGVYAVRVVWAGATYSGMMNVGRAPTIKGGDLGIEVHIFDFGNTLYGEKVAIYCEAWLRDERKFPTLDALVTQLSEDRRAALEVLAGSPERPK